MANHYLLAVDPGRVSGWAIFKLPALLFAYGHLRPDKPKEWVGFWEKYPAYDGRWSLVSEAQFIAPVKYRSERTKMLEMLSKQQKALKTAISAGCWEGAARLNGWDIRDRVHPATWRSAIFGKGRYSAPQAKKLALKIVNASYDLKLKNSQHHTAEAICIGDFARKQMLFEDQM